MARATVQARGILADMGEPLLGEATHRELWRAPGTRVLETDAGSGKGSMPECMVRNLSTTYGAQPVETHS